jgi:hypothetical protein
MKTTLNDKHFNDLLTNSKSRALNTKPRTIPVGYIRGKQIPIAKIQNSYFVSSQRFLGEIRI